MVNERAFGEELRRWREQRRVSQLELATRAGTTQRHLSFVERGRSVPGRGMVVRLAESLGLPLRERNALLIRAGFAPAYSEGTFDDESLHAVREALGAILLGYEPYPAMIINRLGELIMGNDPCAVFFEDVAEELLVEPIVPRRLALHPEGLARRIVNFPTWATHVIDGLHREVVRNPDPALEAQMRELENYVPEAPLPADHVGFAVPMELMTQDGILRLITTLTSFANATNVYLSEIRLEAFLPADDESARLLHTRFGRNPPLHPLPKTHGS